MKDSKDDAVLFFISHCTGMDKACANLEYDSSCERAIKDGFLTVRQTEDIMLSKGMWSTDDEDKISKLESKIKGQEAYLAKLVKVPSRKDTTKNNLDRLRKQLNELISKKEIGLEYSAEKIAYEQKYLYLTWRGVKDPFTKELYWSTREYFDNETDLVLRRNVFMEVIRQSAGFSLTVLRYLARHNLWRIRYLTSLKTNISLFGVELPDYSVDQLSLAYWSHYYQSIYEMLPDDKPADSVIEDDDVLDAYMKSYHDEQNREATASREGKRKGKGGKSPWDHGETLVMRSNPAHNDIEYSETIESVRNKSSTDLSVRNPDNKRNKQR